MPRTYKGIRVASANRPSGAPPPPSTTEPRPPSTTEPRPPSTTPAIAIQDETHFPSLPNDASPPFIDETTDSSNTLEFLTSCLPSISEDQLREALHRNNNDAEQALDDLLARNADLDTANDDEPATLTAQECSSQDVTNDPLRTLERLFPHIDSALLQLQLSESDGKLDVVIDTITRTNDSTSSPSSSSRRKEQRSQRKQVIHTVSSSLRTEVSSVSTSLMEPSTLTQTSNSQTLTTAYGERVVVMVEHMHRTLVSSSQVGTTL
jgi:hypothetical protein